MYMPGRLRTASSPSRTVMESAPYCFGLFFCVFWAATGERLSLGFRAGSLRDCALVLRQSTYKRRWHRLCEGVSTQLSAPCAEFFALGCVPTLDSPSHAVMTALKRLARSVSRTCHAAPCRRCAGVLCATTGRPDR